MYLHECNHNMGDHPQKNLFELLEVCFCSLSSMAAGILLGLFVFADNKIPAVTKVGFVVGSVLLVPAVAEEYIFTPEQDISDTDINLQGESNEFFDV